MTLFRRRSKLLYFVALLSGLAGCATSSNCAAPATDQQVIDCSNQRFNATVGEGAGAGALIGAAIGALADSNDRLEGAAIGGAGGGLVGAGAGYLVARNNFEKASEEHNLNGMIDAARQDAATAHAAAAAARRQAEAAQAEAAQLRVEYRHGEVSADQYRAKLATYQKSADDTQRMIRSVSDRIAEIRKQEQLMGGEGRRELEAQAQQLSEARADLDRSYENMLRALAGQPNA